MWLMSEITLMFFSQFIQAVPTCLLMKYYNKMRVFGVPVRFLIFHNRNLYFTIVVTPQQSLSIFQIEMYFGFKRMKWCDCKIDFCIETSQEFNINYVDPIITYVESIMIRYTNGIQYLLSKTLRMFPIYDIVSFIWYSLSDRVNWLSVYYWGYSRYFNDLYLLRWN